MSFLLAPQYTRRDYRWTAWKTVYAIKGLPFQYDDDGAIYTIWAYDGPEVHVCEIWKDAVPDSALNSYSQNQNDSDKSDFESNYKPSGNGILSQIDADGAQIVRAKAAKRGWSFWALPIEINTSFLANTSPASVYAKDASGNDIPGITAKIYNSSGIEITVPGIANVNLATCTTTVVDFEPAFDYEIIGGSLRVNSNVSSDVRLWIVAAPDIPPIYGGSKEFASGVNLKFLSPDNSFDIDGRVTKYVTYNPITHQGKLRMIFKHGAGVSVNLEAVLHMYKQQ